MSKILGKGLSVILRAYYQGPDHPMKMRFWWRIYKAFGSPRFTIPYKGNGWITVDLRDFLQREIFAAGSYEPEVWEVLTSFINSNEIVWDVGAHVGSFAINALLDHRVKEIHAFEPDPINVGNLTINLALNKGCYTIHHFALSDQIERRKFYQGPQANTGLSSLVIQPSFESFEVRCLTVDQLVFQMGLASPTLMKIDVEGWESQVLQGAHRLLVENPPKAIVFETTCSARGEIPNSLLISYLKSLGYGVQGIKRKTGIIEEKENYLATLNKI